MKTAPTLSSTTAARGLPGRFRPIAHLTPESLSAQLDRFHAGHLRSAALTWEAIERRDDVVAGVVAKRKKAAARLRYQIEPLNDTPEAKAHAAALTHLYKHLRATHACDRNQSGGFSLLVEQMMDAVGKRYAVHEIVWAPAASGELTAHLHFVPLWFFENRTGRLRLLTDPAAPEGTPLEEGAWMTTTGDGLMEATSVAYMYKTLPLRDWLLYSERNGMPGVKGVTEATPGTPEWNAVREAVQDFGAEFRGLFTRGTEIEPIDLTTRGELPYPRLVERMDQAIVALWRGSDLSTLSSSGVGASLQKGETALLEEHDAHRIAETLHHQLDRPALFHRFGTTEPLARIRLITTARQNLPEELRLYRLLHDLGAPLPLQHLYERFELPLRDRENTVLKKL